MMELRPFLPADAPVVLSWLEDEVTFWRWSADRYGHYPITPEELQAYYTAPGMFPMTATEGGVPVGHLLLRWLGEDRRVMRAGCIVLDPARRGRGDGKAMLHLAVSEAKERHHARVLTLGVFADNAPARRCYEAMGLHYTGEDNTYTLAGQDWLCLEMTLEL